MIGATNPLTAEPGTIRGVAHIGRNIIHGSDAETARREVNLGLRKKNLPAGNPALFPGFKANSQRGSGVSGQKRGP